MKSFPKPLTPSEESYYLQKYTEGDLEAKHILIEHNLRLVAHVIKKYQHLDDDPEDLLSIGTIGLIKAIVTFNPEKGNHLATYAARCIEKATPLLRLHFTKKRKMAHLFLNGKSTDNFPTNFSSCIGSSTTLYHTKYCISMNLLSKSLLGFLPQKNIYFCIQLLIVYRKLRRR